MQIVNSSSDLEKQKEEAGIKMGLLEAAAIYETQATTVYSQRA